MQGRPRPARIAAPAAGWITGRITGRGHRHRRIRRHRAADDRGDGWKKKYRRGAAL
ncbi:hypothetical protein IBTHAUMO2_750011 [Nitrosopumilaceae archaeon]|nr:hypothetical protein IBTHAUMO2_750011 [Nitrosopumilaceae archaeon]